MKTNCNSVTIVAPWFTIGEQNLQAVHRKPVDTDRPEGGSFHDLATNDPSQARGPKTRSQPAKPRCVGNSGSHGFFWGPFWLLHFPALWGLATQKRTSPV